MKKILSLVLVIAMLATSCLFFASCSKVSTKKLEKDPQAVLSEALENTSNSFFSDNSDAGKVLDAAMKKGAFTITFESADLMGDVTKISETLYVNDETAKVVSDTAVTYDGKDLNARIFMDQNGVMFNSQSVLGSNKTLAVNYATFADQLQTSALAEMMQLDEATAASLKSSFNTIKTALANAATVDEEAAEKLANEYLAILNQAIAEEKLENAEGKSVKCVTASYTLNNQTLKAYMDKAAAQAGIAGEMKTTYDEGFAAINEMVDINLSAKLYINKKNNEIIKITFGGTVLDKEESTTVTVAADVALSETEIKTTLSVTGGETPMSAELKLTKEEAKDAVTYKLAVTVSEGSVAVNYLNASYTHNEKTGAIVLSADVYEDENTRTSVQLDGKLTVTDTEATLEFTSLKMGDVTVSFKLVLSAKKDVEMPAAPADAKDIVTMTKGEWVDVVEELQQSTLGQLIFGAN